MSGRRQPTGSGVGGGGADSDTEEDDAEAVPGTPPDPEWGGDYGQHNEQYGSKRQCVGRGEHMGEHQGAGAAAGNSWL